MVKQVIVMRKDLNMRKGKLVAQGAHASLKVFLDRKLETEKEYMTIPLTESMQYWLGYRFKKICLYVNSEEELDAVYEKALEKGFPCSMIIDSGLTEFHGVKTKTCIAIGPAESEDINKITGHLPLL